MKGGNGHERGWGYKDIGTREVSIRYLLRHGRLEGMSLRLMV